MPERIINDDQIFSRGSKTYYFASKLFPAEARADVTKLYSFVRVADDFVDELPQRVEKLDELISAWNGASSRDPMVMHVVKNMHDVAGKHDMPKEWVDAFLTAMKLDTHKQHYDTFDELHEYIYGSAEVIGLMMARILGLPHHFDEAAKAQGTAMQLINFTRDIAEDIQLGRTYLPMNELRICGLERLDAESAEAHPEAFTKFMQIQLDRYESWQRIADEALVRVPIRYRIPVQVANDGYRWTAGRIAADPLSVFSVRHKPSRRYLATCAAARLAGR